MSDLTVAARDRQIEEMSLEGGMERSEQRPRALFEATVARSRQRGRAVA